MVLWLEHTWSRTYTMEHSDNCDRQWMFDTVYKAGADSRLVPSQWETSLQSNAVSHWLGANLESAPKAFVPQAKLVEGVKSVNACVCQFVFWTLYEYFFLAAIKQLYDWFSPSVCPSVRPSVTPFSPCSHHRIIMKFSGVITNDKSDVHAKGQGQRSKVKVTEVNTQLNRFRTVTPVWIHIWWWNDAYSLMMLRRGALLFFKVIRQISRSHGSKKRWIWPRFGVSGL